MRVATTERRTDDALPELPTWTSVWRARAGRWMWRIDARRRAAERTIVAAIAASRSTLWRLDAVRRASEDAIAVAALLARQVIDEILDTLARRIRDGWRHGRGPQRHRPA